MHRASLPGIRLLGVATKLELLAELPAGEPDTWPPAPAITEPETSRPGGESMEGGSPIATPTEPGGSGVVGSVTLLPVFMVL